MTEQQAIAAIGYSPDSASVTTCGPRDQPKQLWQCRILKYDYDPFRGPGHTLTIYEAKIGDAWYVDSWSAL
jgi:hypothetical protein